MNKKSIESLDDLKKIKKIDKSGMLDLMLNFSDQCRKGAQIGLVAELPGEFSKVNNIVFSGLGGSAIGGDLIRCLLKDEIAVPIMVNREYSLPDCVDENTLLFAVSYSGNTEETLSAYNQAVTKRAKIIAISSGGILSERAKKDGFPVITIPKGLPPRASLGYLFFPALVSLSKLGFIDDKSNQIDEAIKLMELLRDKLTGPAVNFKKNFAKQLAAEIFGRFVIIYGASYYMEAVVMRWRGQIAENSKHLGSMHLFPEMNHNEIVGWQNPEIIKNFVAVLLRDKDDHPRVKLRMDITKSIIKKEAAKFVEVASSGESLLARMFSLIHIGDMVSLYLAILNGVDPTPVERISYLKAELGKKA